MQPTKQRLVMAARECDRGPPPSADLGRDVWGALAFRFRRPTAKWTAFFLLSLSPIPPHKVLGG